VVLRDTRGTFITLSHFCPTAAAMLQDDVPLRVVEAPPSLALDGMLEGLDATAVLPPLLRRGVLMDYEGYTAWEHGAIAVLDRDDLGADVALDVIAGATERVQAWTPGKESLAGHVSRAFAAFGPASPARHALDSRPLRMFLAAHLFASWASYQKGGLTGVIGAVRNALTLVRQELASGATFVESVRATDLKLRHTADTEGDARA
jgi:hypothetical protein